MQIASIGSGVTTLINKEVETSVQKLMFRLSLASVLPIVTLAEVKAALTALIGGAKITATFEDTLTPWQDISLLNLCEMAANNDGMVVLTSDGVTLSGLFSLEVSNDGALRLSDNKKLVINITNKVSLSTMDIYAMDDPRDAKTLMISETKFLNAATEKDFSTEKYDVLTLPIENITNVKLFYNNGRLVTMGKEEVRQAMLDSQDPIISANQKIFFGYCNQANISIEQCWRVQVTLDASTTIFMTKTVNL